MTITIPTTEAKFFRQSLKILRDIPPLNNLSGRELDVLAHLLYYDYIYRDLEETVRGRLIFDYETRLKIRESIGISEAVLNNLFTAMRKKEIISGKKIIFKIKLTPEDPIIQFKFKIDANVD